MAVKEFTLNGDQFKNLLKIFDILKDEITDVVIQNGNIYQMNDIAAYVIENLLDNSVDQLYFNQIKQTLNLLKILNNNEIKITIDNVKKFNIITDNTSTISIKYSTTLNNKTIDKDYVKNIEPLISLPIKNNEIKKIKQFADALNTDSFKICPDKDNKISIQIESQNKAKIIKVLAYDIDYSQIKDKFDSNVDEISFSIMPINVIYKLINNIKITQTGEEQIEESLIDSLVFILGKQDKNIVLSSNFSINELNISIINKRKIKASFDELVA